MTELLTESFCERCGTRYDLGAAEPLTTAQKTRGLMSGLRQFIMSQDSLSDSIGDAMRAEEDAIAARQIENFQNTFNFCLDCRQYTCPNCWNEDAGRCRSCVPLAGIDDIAGYDRRLAALASTAPPPVDEPAAPMLAKAEGLAWPSEDELPRSAEVEPEPVVEPEPIMEPEPALAAESGEGPELEPEPIAPDRLAPDRWAPEPVLAAEAEPEAPTAPEPEPPIELPRTTPRRDLRDTFVRGPRPVPAPTQPDSAPLAARRSQMDILGIDDPGQGTVSVGQREGLPYRSSGAGSSGLAAVWDVSTKYLEAGAMRAALRPCGSCGLTVSSTARFCRRCGAPQTLSA